jgi:hypothetical protein
VCCVSIAGEKARELELRLCRGRAWKGASADLRILPGFAALLKYQLNFFLVISQCFDFIILRQFRGEEVYSFTRTIPKSLSNAQSK